MAIKLITGNLINDVKDAVIAQIKPFVQDFSCENIIVVPDRFSLIVEKSVFDVLNISSTFNISVMGINALARKLIEKANLNCVFVDQTESDFVLYHAIQNVKDKFVCFSKTLNNGLFEKIKNALALMRSSKIDFEVLQDVTVDDEELNQKLCDLKIVLGEYEKLLGFRLDATNLIKTFSSLIDNTSQYQNTNFYFCGFDSFTAQGYEIVKKICTVVKNVCIGVIRASKFKNKALYDTEMMDTILDFLKEKKLEYEVIDIECKFDDDREYIFENVFGYDIKSKGISTPLIALPTMYDEVDNVAKQIAYLIKHGEKYSNILVASKESYFPLIENVFTKFDISFYIDNSIAIDQTPIYDFLQSVFELKNSGFEKDNILSLISNYFFGLEKSKKYEVIKYIKENNIEYKKIKNIYNYDEKIKYIFEFLNNLENNATFGHFIEIIKNIFQYFDVQNKLDIVSQQFKEMADLGYEKTYIQIFEKIQKLNDKVCAILGEQSITFADFSDFYLNAIGSLKINKIPLSLDCVFVGDIQKSFFEQKKYMFIVGATMDVMKRVSDESLILDNDIKSLENCIKISPTAKMINRRNKFKIFDDFFCAKYLTITYPLQSEDGKKVVAANFITDFEKLGAKKLSKEDFALSTNVESLKFYAPNNKVARESVTANSSGAKIKSALLTLGEDVEYTVLDKNNISSNFIDKDKRIKITQIENYFSCPFKHFASYGLKLVENRDGDIKANDFGNFLHDFCNLIVRMGSKKLGTYDDKTLGLEIEKCFSKLVNSEKYSILKDDENAFVCKLLKNEVKRFGTFLNYEQKCSDFKIFKTEYKFDNSLCVNLNNENYSIVGIVDRVDKYDKYLRVIDYKTGSLAGSNAKIDNLYYGTKIQVYVYLKALTEIFDAKPFGAFYLPILSAFSLEGTDDYKLSGYFIDDAALCQHADKNLLEENKSRLFDVAFSTSKKNIENNIKSIVSRKKVTTDQLKGMLDYSVEIIKQALDEIIKGNIEPSPINDSCKFCPYKDVCGHDENISRKKMGSVEAKTFEVKYE